jgi:hypothetical protein
MRLELDRLATSGGTADVDPQLHEKHMATLAAAASNVRGCTGRPPGEGGGRGGRAPGGLKR